MARRNINQEGTALYEPFILTTIGMTRLNVEYEDLTPSFNLK